MNSLAAITQTLQFGYTRRELSLSDHTLRSHLQETALSSVMTQKLSFGGCTRRELLFDWSHL